MNVRRQVMFPLLGCAVGVAFVACTTEPKLVATSFTVNDTTVTIAALTATAKLTATVFDQHNDTLRAPVNWSSSNPGVVSVTTVSDTGIVTAVANGTAQVSATAGTVSFAVTVTVAQVPTVIVKVSGDAQTATVGTSVANPVTVRVSDALANAIAGVQLTFTALGGGSVGSPTVVTGANGQASTGWTLGNTSGNGQSVQASVATVGVSPVFFAATAAAGTATALTAVTVGTLRGQVNRAIPTAVTVKATDQFGNPAPGVTVTFAVTSGGGSVVTPVPTGGDGTAQTTWTLGPTAGSQTMQASGVGTPIVFTATAVNTNYFVDLRFLTSVTTSQRQAFTDAAAKWESAISGDITDIPASLVVASFCVASQPVLNETIDDLLIFAIIEPIDGPNGILASAGPCYVRTTGDLPVIGLMRFDAADVASLEAAGQFSTVVAHEMGHVIGLGSMWGPSDFNLLADTLSADPYYTGAQGIAAFDAIGGTTYTGGRKVPVENTGGAGTQLGHWRESVFGEELMTGFLNSGVANPLSQLTIASFADMGYTVNTAAADPYIKVFTVRAAGPVPEAPTFDLSQDILRTPIMMIDARGRVTGVLRR